MSFESFKETIIKEIEPVIKDNFMELVNIEIVNGSYIRVYIDKQGGVSLDDCAIMHKTIDKVIENKGIISGKYVLEVSSPGMNRQLNKKEDFEKFSGKKVKIVTKEGIEKENVYKGNIKGVNENSVIVVVEDKEVEIDFDNIKKARIDEEYKF